MLKWESIGAGTVSIIVDDYKTGLDNFDLDSFRELTLEEKLSKQGLPTQDVTARKARFISSYCYFNDVILYYFE